jgi:osmoprotectant transport system permease protein
MSLRDFFIAHKRDVLTLTGEHLWLVGISMLLAVAIGVPLGILLSRRPAWKGLVLGANNIMQTIPSLALFGLLLPILALTMYALLPVVRNTLTGIAGVDPPVREAALGMGLTPRQLLWHVELPLASNVIVAGIRTATVITVGVATIAAAIGAGGLGEFIFRGLAMVDNNVILTGAIPAALMALFADLVLGLIQRSLVRTRVRVHH